MLTQVTEAATAIRGSDGTEIINGRLLAFKVEGSGSPSVIFETGLGAESDEWEHVQRTVAQHSGTFRYDRAGRGASDPARPGRDAYTMVDDLHELLHTVRVPVPYVLVGHSLGGLLTRVFAKRYPEEVAGMVLVDSMHEDQFDVFGGAFPPPGPGDPPQLIGLRHFWTGGWKEFESTAERLNLPETVRQGREVESLGDLPVHVITAGTFLNGPFVPPSERGRLQFKWEELQAKFLRLSSRTKQSFVRDCGHFVQRERPEVIVQAILDIQRSA
ncbi:MAG: alpha/beta fold hydrolase [Sphingomonas sp.]